MAEVKWIKIVTDIFDDEKIMMIEGLPERDGIIVIWFKLLCLAGKSNNSGVLMFNDRIAYTDEMLATIFRRPLSTVRMALKVFEEYGMIEIVNDTITIPKWEKHQQLDALEKSREQSRARVNRCREKQKAIACNATGNATETLQKRYGNASVTECNADRIREEKDIDNNIYADFEAEFNRLWKKYPRKEGKTNAQKAYIKARTDKKAPVTFEEVDKGLDRYINHLKAEKTEHQYIKHGSTWFNQCSWNDDYSDFNEQSQTAPEEYDFSDWYEEG